MFLAISLVGSATAQLYITGDLNSDHKVDIKDLRMFAWQWLDPDCLEPGCTADLDGADGVNMADFALFANKWQTRAPHIVISEFMARNASVPPLEDGEP
mgnify:CR=1 FL=1